MNCFDSAILSFAPKTKELALGSDIQVPIANGRRCDDGFLQRMGTQHFERFA